MAMSETAMYEHGNVELGEDQIRPTGQPFRVKTVPKAVFMQKSPHSKLGFSVFVPDLRHHAGSGFLIYDINHSFFAVLGHSQSAQPRLGQYLAALNRSDELLK